jgi:hypothetical protein
MRMTAPMVPMRDGNGMKYGGDADTPCARAVKK